MAGERITIPAAQIEFVDGGNTIWVHSPAGATILRIRARGGGKIKTERCQSSPVSHGDIVVEGDIAICLAGDAEDDDTTAALAAALEAIGKAAPYDQDQGSDGY